MEVLEINALISPTCTLAAAHSSLGDQTGRSQHEHRRQVVVSKYSRLLGMPTIDQETVVATTTRRRSPRVMRWGSDVFILGREIRILL